MEDDARRDITKRFRLSPAEERIIQRALEAEEKEISDVAREQLMRWARAALRKHGLSIE